MISNEAVQRLLAVDRETLIQLLALAYTHGVERTTPSHHHQTDVRDTVRADPDILGLLDEARLRATQPAQAGIAWERWHERGW